MTLSEADRHAIHDHFISQMGEHLAGQLMNELVHGVEWGALVTRDTLRAEIAGVNAGIAEVRSETRTEIAKLRAEMHQGFRRLTSWVASLQIATLGAVAALAIRGG